MTTHKKHGTPEYKIWMRMKKSCYTPLSTQYKSYGAKGYTICQEWKGDFTAFLRDMGLIPKDHKGIAIIDKNCKVFKPGNVRWTKDGRGRPKKPMNMPYARKAFAKSAKVLLTLEKAHLDMIKSAAYRKSLEVGHLIEPNDILRNLIKKEFPIGRQIDMFP